MNQSFFPYKLFTLSLLLLFFAFPSFAQNIQDSVQIQKVRIADSTEQAEKAAAQAAKLERERTKDSLADVRTYLKSKRYNDSLIAEREKRLDSIRLARQQYNDSVKNEQIRVNDSLKAERIRVNDSLNAILAAERAIRQHELDSMKQQRQIVADSMAAIRAYRESKAYKDSVTLVRQQRLDSIKAERKAHNDSLIQVRKAENDSLTAVRKAYNDSLKAIMDSTRAVRQLELDSLRTIRQIRSDSLAKVKEGRDLARKERDKEKEKKKSLALELKIQKEQDAFTNEDMKKKKWTLARKIIQNTFTRYNYYYNANRKLEEAERNMMVAHIDNYDSLLSLFPFDPNTDAGRMATDMDSIISKASVGIQIHDPRSKWQDDLFLIAGQAYYYKGDYDNAEASFKFIVAEAEVQKREDIKNKKRDKNELAHLAEPDKTGISGTVGHRSSKNEAMLWLSRVLVKKDDIGQAQAVIDLIESDEKFPDRLKGQLALEQANIDINNHNLAGATTQLAIVAESKELPLWQRQRASYLNAQIYQNNFNFSEADKYYKYLIGMNPPLEMDFYAKRNMAYNSIESKDIDADLSSMLGKMTNDDKYRPYFDQVYYALASINIAEGKHTEALQNLEKSITAVQNNTEQKGLSYALMGDEYYKTNAYLNASSAYDSAQKYLTEKHQDKANDISQRNTHLTKVVAPYQQVQSLDSLITLSQKSEREQRSIIRQHIRQIERDLIRAQNAEEGASPVTTTGMNTGAPGNWYFNNPVLMQKGTNDFKAKWGNIKLTDNWRRSSTQNNMDNFAQTEEESNTGIDHLLPSEDSLFAAIPNTPDQLAKVNSELQKAYYELGGAFYNLVQDYPKAIEIYNELDKRFPNHPYGAELLYHKYLMALRNQNIHEAEEYKALILELYATSTYAQQVNISNSEQVVALQKSDVSIASYYDSTYSMLNTQMFEEVIERSELYKSIYPSQSGAYAKQFNLLKALALGGKRDYVPAVTILKEMIALNPTDSISFHAQAALNYMYQQDSTLLNSTAPLTDGQNGDDLSDEELDFLFGDDGLNEGQSISTVKAFSGPDIKSTEAAVTFEKDLNSPHTLIIYASKIDGKYIALKNSITQFNNTNGFEDKTTNLQSFNSGSGFILVKDFKNNEELSSYKALIASDTKLYKDYEHGNQDVLLLPISNSNLQKLNETKNLKSYITFMKANY